MDKIRRIDWHIQLVIGALSLVMVWTIYFTLIGEAILGAWQLVSAISNTFPMLRGPFRKQIRTYWILVAISLLLLISSSEILIGISVVGSWGIAWYYWRTYKLFIEHTAYRRELEALVRH